MALARIAELYNRLNQKDVTTTYVGGVDASVLKNHMEEINTVVKGVIHDLNIKVHPMNLSKDDREHVLGARIKSSSKWQSAFKGLVNCVTPDIDPDELMPHVYNPDWNSSQIGLAGLDYDAAFERFMNTVTVADDIHFAPNSSLAVELGISHSYYDQLTRMTGKKPIDFDSMSVSGLLKTADNYIPLGFRGGTNFSNVLMNSPVGSAEARGENPLFFSMQMELLGEMGLSLEDISRMNLIGRAVDKHAQNGEVERSYFMFELRTPLTLQEVLSRWSGAKDRDEHKYLVPLPEDDADYVLDFFARNKFNYDLAMQRRAENGIELRHTIPENVGTVLPQCVVSTLLGYVHSEGESFAKKAEEVLGKNFDLTSCFNR
ncbi:MAG: hypothetical protein KKF68_01925 [Nanoarchaeota archaeon]|nr:hypothetical protein [Nanoarchaeota archaeon]